MNSNTTGEPTGGLIGWARYLVGLGSGSSPAGTGGPSGPATPAPAAAAAHRVGAIGPAAVASGPQGLTTPLETSIREYVNPRLADIREKVAHLQVGGEEQLSNGYIIHKNAQQNLLIRLQGYSTNLITIKSDGRVFANQDLNLENAFIALKAWFEPSNAAAASRSVVQPPASLLPPPAPHVHRRGDASVTAKTLSTGEDVSEIEYYLKNVEVRGAVQQLLDRITNPDIPLDFGDYVVCKTREGKLVIQNPDDFFSRRKSGLMIDLAPGVVEPVKFSITDGVDSKDRSFTRYDETVSAFKRTFQSQIVRSVLGPSQSAQPYIETSSMTFKDVGRRDPSSLTSLRGILNDYAQSKPLRYMDSSRCIFADRRLADRFVILAIEKGMYEHPPEIIVTQDNGGREFYNIVIGDVENLLLQNCMKDKNPFEGIFSVYDVQGDRAMLQLEHPDAALMISKVVTQLGGKVISRNQELTRVVQTLTDDRLRIMDVSTKGLTHRTDSAFLREFQRQWIDSFETSCRKAQNIDLELRRQIHLPIPPPLASGATYQEKHQQVAELVDNCALMIRYHLLGFQGASPHFTCQNETYIAFINEHKGFTIQAFQDRKQGQYNGIFVSNGTLNSYVESHRTTLDGAFDALRQLIVEAQTKPNQ